MTAPCHFHTRLGAPGRWCHLALGLGVTSAQHRAGPLPDEGVSGEPGLAAPLPVASGLVLVCSPGTFSSVPSSFPSVRRFPSLQPWPLAPWTTPVPRDRTHRFYAGVSSTWSRAEPRPPHPAAPRVTSVCIASVFRLEGQFLPLTTSPARLPPPQQNIALRALSVCRAPWEASSARPHPAAWAVRSPLQER